jgi:hypothetical protein
LGPPGTFFQILILGIIFFSFIGYFKNTREVLSRNESSIIQGSYFDKDNMEWNISFDVILKDETEDAHRKAFWIMMLIQLFAISISCIAIQNYIPQLVLYLALTLVAIYGLRSIVEDLAILIMLLSLESMYTVNITVFESN